LRTGGRAEPLALRFVIPNDMTTHQGDTVSARTILIVIILLLLLGALPTWPYSGGWGYYPSGGLGLVLLIVVIVALLGRR
jgi:Protein of unknown function (DUF3309)